MNNFRDVMDLIESSIRNKYKRPSNIIKYKNNKVPFIAINKGYGILFTKGVYIFELNKKLLKETDIILRMMKNKYNKNHELITIYNGTVQIFEFEYKHSYKKLFRKLRRYCKSYKIVKINLF